MKDPKMCENCVLRRMECEVMSVIKWKRPMPKDPKMLDITLAAMDGNCPLKREESE